MNCYAFSLGLTSLILMTISKNPALLQKILENRSFWAPLVAILDFASGGVF